MDRILQLLDSIKKQEDEEEEKEERKLVTCLD